MLAMLCAVSWSRYYGCTGCNVSGERIVPLSPPVTHLASSVQCRLWSLDLSSLPGMSVSCSDILFHILQAQTLRCISNRNLGRGAWSGHAPHLHLIKPDIPVLCFCILVNILPLVISPWVIFWQLIINDWLRNPLCEYQDMILTFKLAEIHKTRIKSHLLFKLYQNAPTIFGSQTTQQLYKMPFLPSASSNPDPGVLFFSVYWQWTEVAFCQTMEHWNMYLAMFLFHKWSFLRRWTERWCVWQRIQKWNEKVFDYRFLSRVLMGKTGLKRLCSSVPTYFVLNKNPTNILFIIPRYNLWSLAICFFLLSWSFLLSLVFSFDPFFPSLNS